MTHDRPSRAELMQDWAVDPPDVMYRSALWLVAQGKPPWDGAPPELARAWAYLRPGEGGLASLGQQLAADPPVAGSFAIAGCSAARRLVRGLVLAGAPVEEIAACMGLPDGVIALYEEIFWDVRPRLSARGYIYLAIESLGLNEEEAFHIQLAYAHGADAFLQALGIRRLQPEISELLQKSAPTARACVPWQRWSGRLIRRGLPHEPSAYGCSRGAWSLETWLNMNG